MAVGCDFRTIAHKGFDAEAHGGTHLKGNGDTRCGIKGSVMYDEGIIVTTCSRSIDIF